MYDVGISMPTAESIELIQNNCGDDIKDVITLMILILSIQQVSLIRIAPGSPEHRAQWQFQNENGTKLGEPL